MSSWNTPGALARPKGITLYSYKPLCQAKPVFSLSLSSRGICQYPLFKSRVVKYFDSPRTANMSSITGGGQLDLLQMRLSFLKSVQNLFDPPFLSTTTIWKLQGDLEGCIILAASISFIALSTVALFEKRSPILF